MTDCLIAGGDVVSPTGVRQADIAIEDGEIAAVGPGLPRDADDVVDAEGTVRSESSRRVL